MTAEELEQQAAEGNRYRSRTFQPFSRPSFSRTGSSERKPKQSGEKPAAGFSVDEGAWC